MITAGLVKELRERTGAGMMECKKALVEMNGDLEASIEHMRKTGLTKADKKSGRIAAEGLVLIESNSEGTRTVCVEINSETDFVSSSDDFVNFANAVATLAANQPVESVEALNALTMESGATVDETRRELIAKIGEKISVRRLSVTEHKGNVGSYSHNKRIGVVVDLNGGSSDVAHDVAMHIAAFNPAYAQPSDVPADVVEKEREIQMAQAKDLGKPPEILEKIIQGKLDKWLGEITLVGQPFVKDSDITVGQYLKQASAEVNDYSRLEVGEGIEKKQENFAEEVAAQLKDS